MPAPFQRHRPSRNVAVRRLFNLLSLLAVCPRDLEELARELVCSTRTVRRDLALLEEVHVPITQYGPYYRLSGPLPYARHRAPVQSVDTSTGANCAEIPK